MTEQNEQNETSRYTKEQLSKLALYLTASIFELAEALHESSAEIIDPENPPTQEQLHKHLTILAAVNGCTVGIAAILGAKTADFSALAQQTAASILAGFDTLQSAQSVQEDPPATH